MSEKFDRYLSVALKVKLYPKLLKNRIIAYRPVIVDVSKSAKINIKDCL